MKTSCLYTGILLLLGPSFAFSMGLGDIKVKSALNQPFYAEIPLLDVGNTPLNGIKAGLASLDEFQRVGLELDDVLSLFKFRVEKNRDGVPVIQITSQDRVTEPYLQILVDLAWSNGQLYRSYTVLLDPPGYKLVAPANHINQVISYKSGQNEVGESGIVNKPVYTQVVKGETVKHQRAEASYGPTIANESIWEIAQRYSTSDTTLQQIILAIVGTNSQAFTQGNLNGLKIGERLRIPSNDEVLKVPADLAKQEVEAHDVAWKTHQEIKHVLLPPYIDGVVGISQFNKSEDDGVASVSQLQSDTMNNDLKPSEIAPAPVFKQEALKAPLVFIQAQSFPAVAVPITTGVVNPVSYIPSIIGLTSANSEKNAVAVKSLSTENTLLKDKLSDLQIKNSQLQKQNEEFQALRKQVQSIGTESDNKQSQKTDTASPPVPESSNFWLYLLLIAGLSGAVGLGCWIRLRRSEETFDEQLEEPVLSPRLSGERSPSFEENKNTLEPAPISIPAEKSSDYPAESMDINSSQISELEESRPVISSPTTAIIAEPESAIVPEKMIKEDSLQEEISSEPTFAEEAVEQLVPLDIPPEKDESDGEKPVHFVDFEPGLDKFIASNRLHEGSAGHIDSSEQRINYEAASTDKKRRKIKQSDENMNPVLSETTNKTGKRENPVDQKLESELLDKSFVNKAPKLAKSKAALDTLLALAKTYMSMEDFETAKQSLEEVLNFGNENQKREAQKLMEELKNK